MNEQNQRRADRVPCRVPLILNCGGIAWRGTAVDVSRTGLRLKLPFSVLGIEGTPTLLTLTHRLSEVLPPRAPVTFDPERLGPLIERDLEIVRVGLSGGSRPEVEIACRFDHPLTEIDAAAIGVDVPQRQRGEAPKGEPILGAPDDISAVAMRPGAAGPPLPRSPRPAEKRGSREETPRKLPRADTTRKAPFRGPALDDPMSRGVRPATISADGTAHFDVGGATSLHGCLEPRLRQRCRRFRVSLAPLDEERARPVLGWTERLDAESLSVLVPQRDRLDLPSEARDVRALLTAFCDLYGTRFQMSVLDGSRTVWNGPVHIRAAEIYHAHEDALVLDLEFASPLHPAQVRELGLT